MITRKDCVKIGEVSKTHHLQGAVVITTDSDLLERYADEPVFLLLEGAPVPFFISGDGLVCRNHTSYIVKFDYVDSLRQAERLVGAEVMLEKARLKENETKEADFDISGLVGFQAEDTLSGTKGEVTDAADYSGNPVLTLSIFGKEVLLPFSEAYVSGMDAEHRVIRVTIPAELVDLN